MDQFSGPAPRAVQFFDHFLHGEREFRAEKNMADLTHRFRARPAIQLLRAVIPITDMSIRITHNDGVMAQVQQAGFFP